MDRANAALDSSPDVRQRLATFTTRSSRTSAAEQHEGCTRPGSSRVTSGE
ncbi:hypothetical protein [Streptomyces sp. NPDC059651]